MKLVIALSGEGIKDVADEFAADMSMGHKAFVVDYEAFADQLSDILKTALVTNNDDDLVHFIEANISSLKDPYEGDPLDSSWEDLVETKDAHSYGDIALTKFYDP